MLSLSLRPLTNCAIGLLCWVGFCVSATPTADFEKATIQLPTLLSPGAMKGEAVLFGFDPAAFRDSDQVTRTLIRGTPVAVCIPPGKPGAPDQRIAYYGTVIRIGPEDFRMWYMGVGAGDGLRPCYATSKDGIAWTKPELGLVEYAGIKANNVLDFPVAANSLHEPVVVLYDPEDPDTNKRFKMVFEYLPETTWGTAASPDGLRWHLLTQEKLKPWLEMSGLTKYRGRYYVTGQGGFPQPQPWYRRVGVFVSDDFVNWTFAGIGFDRSPKGKADYHFLKHEQAHLGAGLWNRGDVILGIYGQWHGVPEGKELKTINMLGDLGLILSHDAARFEEPLSGFTLVEEKTTPPPSSPEPYAHALMQGQGMYNVGVQTLFWYAHWGGPEIHVATWKRDRLGYLAPQNGSASVLSCPIKVVQGQVKVYLNAKVAPGKEAIASIVNIQGQPLPGFSKASVTGDFLHQQLNWEGGGGLEPTAGTVRLKISGTGDWQLYAMYLGEGEPEILDSAQ